MLTMINTKDDIIRHLSFITSKKMGRNGFCFNLFGHVEYNGKDYSIYSSAFSENIPGEEGKLFFRLSRDHMHDEVEILAEDLTYEQLLEIVKQNE